MYNRIELNSNHEETTALPHKLSNDILTSLTFASALFFLSQSASNKTSFSAISPSIFYRTFTTQSDHNRIWQIMQPRLNLNDTSIVEQTKISWWSSSTVEADDVLASGTNERLTSLSFIPLDIKLRPMSPHLL